MCGGNAIRIVPIALGALLVTGCAPKHDMLAAQGEIANFHSAFNRGDFASILNHASKQVNGPGTALTMIKILKGTKAKLGSFEAGKLNGWRVNYTTSGKFTLVTNKSRFSRGEAIETFVFVDAGSAKRLAGYNINSAAFIPQ